MFAILTAGGTPEIGDPLYEFTLGRPKAMVEINGKPMVQWVIDAFDTAKTIEGVLLIGLGPDDGITCSKPIFYFPDQAGLLENILMGVQELLHISPGPQRVVVSSSDIPTLKGEMVDWLVETANQTDHDLYYNIITRQVMEKRFPTSHRTYIHLKDMVVCGGDVNMIHTRAVTSDLNFWQKVVSSRKNPIKQASLVGYGTLLRLLVHQITLEQAVNNVTKRIGMSGRALMCPYAEIGMDVDKPHQLGIMRQDLQPKFVAVSA